MKIRLISQACLTLLLLSNAMLANADEMKVHCPSIAVIKMQAETLDTVAKFTIKPDASGYVFAVSSSFRPFFDSESQLNWSLDAGVYAFDFNTAFTLAQDKVKKVTAIDPYDQEYAERFEDGYFCGYMIGEDMEVEAHAYDYQQHSYQMSLHHSKIFQNR